MICFHHPNTRHTPLTEVLKRAEEEIDHLAQACGAISVLRAFGLTPQPDADFTFRPGSRASTHPIAPGFSVVAEVTLVNNLQPLSSKENPELYARVNGIINGHKKYNRQREAEGWDDPIGSLIDGAPNQLGLGPDDTLYWVDVDPLIGRFGSTDLNNARFATAGLIGHTVAQGRVAV